MFKKIMLTTAITTLTILTFTGCSTSPTQNMPVNNTSNSTVVSEFTKIIDVRTPAEWNEGHLDGATLITLESPDFIQQISTLDKKGNYYIYCRSGNRAGQAIEIMKAEGFTGNLVNGGSVAEASNELGMPVTK